LGEAGAGGRAGEDEGAGARIESALLRPPRLAGSFLQSCHVPMSHWHGGDTDMGQIKAVFE
jgi:hypothetical protein